MNESFREHIAYAQGFYVFTAECIEPEAASMFVWKPEMCQVKFLTHIQCLQSVPVGKWPVWMEICLWCLYVKRIQSKEIYRFAPFSGLQCDLLSPLQYSSL